MTFGVVLFTWEPSVEEEQQHDDGQAAAHIAVEGAVADGDFALIAGVE